MADTTRQYGNNREFLKKYIKIIELRRGKSAITLVPGWQGRVMTSTSDGDSGFSYGWINREFISDGIIAPHINPYGGEERLWLGPEGGQYSLFFKKGTEFLFKNWQTPAFIDTEPFNLISANDTSAKFASQIETENYNGYLFKFKIERTVTLLTSDEITNTLGIDLKHLSSVSYISENKLINESNESWNKDTGLISIWMLSMYNPSPSVVVVIPIRQGDENKLGVKVNDNYFGKVEVDRLKLTDNHIFFKADGKKRGKIGIPQLRTSGLMGSYDSENKILTFLICKVPAEETDYVNSSWEIQENPFNGDAYNSYNDGPLEDGTQMGPFYEMETSSPAYPLKSGDTLIHVQQTIHLSGSANDLDIIARKILGVSLDAIVNIFEEKHQ